MTSITNTQYVSDSFNAENRIYAAVLDRTGVPNKVASECSSYLSSWCVQQNLHLPQKPDCADRDLCRSLGTCVLLCHIAGARSKTGLMGLLPLSSYLSGLNKPEERVRGSEHSSWMGTLHDNNHNFPLEDNTLGSLPELDCRVPGTCGAHLVWRVW